MRLTYVDGYAAGQHDALTWLVAVAKDDAELAAFERSVQLRAAMVCLAHNLKFAAAIQFGVQLGYARCAGNHEGAQLWHPGCGRPAPGWRES